MHNSGILLVILAFAWNILVIVCAKAEQGWEHRYPNGKDIAPVVSGMGKNCPSRFGRISCIQGVLFITGNLVDIFGIIYRK
jgi:hypothetical protein